MLMDFVFGVGSEFLCIICMDSRLQRVDILNAYVFRLEQELSAGTKMNSRILVVTGSADSASQYMNYMNVFFTAQKQVTILRNLRFCHSVTEESILLGCDGVFYIFKNQHNTLI